MGPRGLGAEVDEKGAGLARAELHEGAESRCWVMRAVWEQEEEAESH